MPKVSGTGKEFFFLTSNKSYIRLLVETIGINPANLPCVRKYWEKDLEEGGLNHGPISQPFISTTASMSS